MSAAWRSSRAATALLRASAAQRHFAADGGAAAAAAAAPASPSLDKFRERLASGPDFGAFLSGTGSKDGSYSVAAPPLKVCGSQYTHAWSRVCASRVSRAAWGRAQTAVAPARGCPVPGLSLAPPVSLPVPRCVTPGPSAEAGVDEAGAGAWRRALHGNKGEVETAEAAHSMRGSEVPQPGRVLGWRRRTHGDSDHHADGRHLHTRLSLLRREDEPSATSAGPRGAKERGGSYRRVGPRLRRPHER